MSELRWGEVRRQALLGATSAQDAQDPVDELLAQLSEAFLLTQGARVTLEPTLLSDGLRAQCLPAPPQLGVHPARRERLRALLSQPEVVRDGKPQHTTLALCFDLCTLAHLNRTLPLMWVAPVLSRVLSPLQAQGSATQLHALLHQLPLPLDALLSAIGPRGRWLLTQEPTWRRALSELEGPLIEREVRVSRVSVEALEQGLDALTRGELPQGVDDTTHPSIALSHLLMMSHPSALRASLKSDAVRALFKDSTLDYTSWASLLQSDLIEQIDAECRS